jgi:hypothetical protein
MLVKSRLFVVVDEQCQCGGGDIVAKTLVCIVGPDCCVHLTHTGSHWT